MHNDGGIIEASPALPLRTIKISDRWFVRILVIICMLAITAFAWHLGIKLRQDAWQWSDGAHFQGDVSNAFRWGTRAHNFGLYAFYDNLEAGVYDLPNARNDYPPLRITIATKWREWAHDKYPDVTFWQDDYEFTYPMIRMNIIAEAASCVLVFVIIVIWRRRCLDVNRQWHSGLVAGMLGMLAFWFNPAIIWDGHCWPQWDVWLIPFFLLAILLYFFDFCTLAGISLAIGACLKGQLLLAAPVLILVPLFTLNLGAFLRIVFGFIFGMGWIVIGFMQPSNQAFHWYLLFILALAIVTPVVLRWIKTYWWINLILLIVAMLIAYPWQAPASIQGWERLWRIAGPVMILVVAGSMFFRSERRVHFYIATLGVSIFLLIPLFGASDAWYRYGFAYGTEKFASMMTGTGTYNVPAMMRQYIGWPNGSDEPVEINFHWNSITLSFTQVTRIIYAICVVLCGIGAAIQYHRRDPRFLAAMVAPWLLFYMILTQMHGRYPLWAAGMSALLFGINSGMGLLGLIVSFVAAIGIANNQLAFRRDWWPEFYTWITAMNPHLGWILLLSALIYLYHTVVPSRKSELRSR